MSGFSVINDKEIFEKALKLAKGSYQRNILNGYESLSGSTLTGKAQKYSGRYRQSSQNLIKRCQQNGLLVREITGEHNKRILVIG